jgi:DNA-binding NtrC family response regulator
MMHAQPHVLVVDEDESILSAFSDFLRKEHCTMLAASDADRAMEMITHDRVDLLIADLQLKSRSGLIFFLHVKMQCPSLPVIAMTGYPEQIPEHDVIRLGASYFFLKPLDLGRMRDAIRDCLRSPRAGATAPE